MSIPATPSLRQCIAFAGKRAIATGSRAEVALAARAYLDGDPNASILVFDSIDSELLEFDLRGTTKQILERIAATEPAAVVPAGTDPEAADDAPRGPGRPKLGVVAREVTLLPRHWEWLATQRGGASVTLRRLVEQARKTGEGQDRKRRAQESAYRFMSAMAGDLAGFEEATRAFFVDDAAKLETVTAGWPADVRGHALVLAGAAFSAAPAQGDTA